MTKRYPVAILDYMVTSNHVHLLVSIKNPEALSAGLRFLHGQVARTYNKMTKREGAFWTNRFYSTLIQDGEYLGRCLFYIDLNMMRAGVTGHPAEWKHTAYHEFTDRKRYKKIVNFTRLLNALEFDEPDTFRSWYINTLNSKLDCINFQRELYWSRAVAVGDEDWLNKIQGRNKKYSIIHQNNINEPFYISRSKIR
jgi:putative transposase